MAVHSCIAYGSGSLYPTHIPATMLAEQLERPDPTSLVLYHQASSAIIQAIKQAQTR